MSRLLCKCGHGMSNSDVPSDSIVEIFRPKEIASAISNRMELIDLWNKQVQFWYCQHCKRITLINNNTGRYIKSYIKASEDNVKPFSEHSDWDELIFYRDCEIYNATEAIWHITVEQFMKMHSTRYKVILSPSEEIVRVFHPYTNEYLFSYQEDIATKIS